MRLYHIIILFIFSKLVLASENNLPKIISDKTVRQQHYLPDFSFAGYRHGTQLPDTRKWQVIDVSKHKIKADDGKDDSQALIKLLTSLETSNKPVVLQFQPGQYIISSIIYIGRSNIVLRGAGSGEGGTTFHLPRPLNYVNQPQELEELREYLVTLNKVEKQKKSNIYLPYSQWSWSGGFFWTRVKGARVKKYLEKYDPPNNTLTKAYKGTQGGFTLSIHDAKQISIGDIIEIQWVNNQGEKSEFLKEIYPADELKIGSHHWSIKNLAIAKQQVEVVAKTGNNITIKSPLLHNITEQRDVRIAAWEHLNEVGFEHFSLIFAYAAPVAHHVEQGFNGIYLTRVYNSWVNNISIKNADSGILTEEVANVSIKNIHTRGEKLAHYTVQLGATHNVLVSKLNVENPARHPLSFNTHATKNVYHRCSVKHLPVFDQHSGANQQNLFDAINTKATLKNNRELPLFSGSGGAKYWKPSAGAYNTFWNVYVDFSNGHQSKIPVLLNGIQDAPSARLIGIHGNLPVKIDYAPSPYIEATNQELSDIPSLYEYQLNKRIYSGQ